MTLAHGEISGNLVICTSGGGKKVGFSCLITDANRYAIETVGDPAYPLLLFRRVITVSLETMKIVRALPALGDGLS